MTVETLTADEIRQILGKTRPATVRRVLPKRLIEQHLKIHLRQLLTMMDSFQAVLTFPTEGRHLPMAALRQIRRQLGEDLKQADDKLKQEGEFVMGYIKRGQTLQTSIMMDVVSEQAFPFCLLNEVNYNPQDNRGVDNKLFIPCYVTLWAQHPKPEDPIQIWLQLEPMRPEHRRQMPRDKLRSKPVYLQVPTGEACIHAFDTAVQVSLYDEPSELEAIYAGKDFASMVKELEFLRRTLVRKKGDKGDFLHVTWRREARDKSLFVA